MESNPHLIIVRAHHEAEVYADGVDLHLTVQGSSLVTGRAALTKAKEVARLTSELFQAGVSEQDVHLEGVHAQVQSGLLGKTSTATYSLKVRCHELELLPELLGIITSQKNTAVNHLEWSYPESADAAAAWLSSCVATAEIKAQGIARSLGIAIQKVHRVIEERAEHVHRGPWEGAAPMMMAARSSAAPDFGMSLMNAKRVDVWVTVEYSIA